MKLTYDPEFNIAYIHLKRKRGRVRTVTVSDELNVDVAADGSVYGIELLNANEQLSADGLRKVVVENKSTGKSNDLPLTLPNIRAKRRVG